MPGVLEGFIPTILHHTEAMLDDISGHGEIVDCLPILEDRIMSTTLETSLGLENVDESLRIGLVKSVTNFLRSQSDRIFRFYAWNEQTENIYIYIYIKLITNIDLNKTK